MKDLLKPDDFAFTIPDWLGLMCLAQGHNAGTLERLEPEAPLSRVKHSTTEPLRSLIQ